MRVIVLVLGLVLSALSSACGSQLHPDDVRAVGQTGTGVAVSETGQDLGGTTTSGEGGSSAAADVDTSVGIGGGSTSTSGGSTSTSGGGPTAGADQPGDPTGGTRAGSCDGFENSTGITDDEIIVANSSDLSGPVPGLFESARLGTAAYLAYFNSRSDVCGRKLTLLELDSKTDSAADQAAYARACAESFAAVGSVSIYDAGGARTAEECGLPDLRANILTQGRADCATCFSAQALEPGVITDAAYRFYAEQDPQAVKSAAFLYLELGGSPDLARSFSEAAESVGFGVKILKGIGSAEFNYAPFVQELKDKDIGFVSFTGATIQAVRLADAMAQQNYEPSLFIVTQTQYGPELHEQGGDNVDGVMAPVPHPAFNSGNPEVTQYVQWLQRVKPGAAPSTFGLFAWSSARLFAERAVALGGELSRETMLAEIRKVKGWTAGGMHTEMEVGAKKSSPCQTVVQLQKGVWRQISGKGYTCGNLVRTSVVK